MKNSLVIFALFVFGVICGLFPLAPKWLCETGLSRYALYVLMFLVGIAAGSNRKTLKIIQAVNVKIVLVPLSAVIGTMLGVGLVSFFIPDLNVRECLAVGCGFGYYSLSSVLITQIHGETLGAIALLSNISREIVTLLATPIMARYFSKLAFIASGGATAMDTTLPVITKFVGKEYAIVAVFSGTVLTLLIPFLVTFIIKI